MERLDEFSSDELSELIKVVRHQRKQHQEVISKHQELFGEDCDGSAYLRRRHVHDVLSLWETQLRNALNAVLDREKTYNN